MCKILVIPGVKPEKQKQVIEFIEAIAPSMTTTPDNDGFGYAQMYDDGSIYGEKWLKPADVFVKRTKKETKAKKRMLDMFGKALKDTNSVNSSEYVDFGTRPKNKLPIAYIAHSRNKTMGAINIENTHPFVELTNPDVPPTALIHNGTIRNHEKLATKKYSTCDSEVILHEWLNLNMFDDISSMPELAKKLIGEYAVGILTTAKTDDGQTYPAIDLFKSNKELYCAYIKELETYVFCTNKYSIESAATKTKFTIQEMFEFQDGFYFRIDAASGEVVEWIDFILSQTTEVYSGQHFNHHRPAGANLNNFLQGATSSNVNKLNEIKQNFEKNHSELFLDYYEVKELTDKDKELLKTLEANTEPDSIRALSLVKMTLAQAN